MGMRLARAGSRMLLVLLLAGACREVPSGAGREGAVRSGSAPAGGTGSGTEDGGVKTTAAQPPSVLRPQPSASPGMPVPPVEGAAGEAAPPARDAGAGAATAEAPAAVLLSGPYVINLTRTSATVCWQTVGTAEGAVLLRGPEGKARDVSPPSAAGRFHAVRLDGLEPGAEYRAAALSRGENLGEVAFRTAPVRREVAERFTFYVYGDTRSFPARHGTVARAMRADVDRRGERTFVVCLGDFAVSRSDEVQTAEQFFNPARPVLEVLPLVPVKGNHECRGGLFTSYFPGLVRHRPGTELNDYVFDYGSVRIVVLDQYGAERGEDRLAWLAGELEGARDTWRVVAFHEPAYSSGGHGSNEGWRDYVEPTLVAAKVHVVFAGHDHDYERMRPQKGIVHVVSGGGGAPLGRGGGADFTAFFRSVLHFITVEVSPERLRLTAHEVDAPAGSARVMDAVDIAPDCGWPQPVTPNAGW